MAPDTGDRLKWPLIVAATLVVLRIILEQLGAPDSINNLLGVAWLHFLVPFYLAYRIQESQSDRPYRALFKELFLYTVYTRLMVMVTYWLAYLWQWQSPRFLVSQGGNVGEGIGPLQGYLVIPGRNAVVWIVMAMVIGLALGSILLLIKGRGNKTAGADSS